MAGSGGRNLSVNSGRRFGWVLVDQGSTADGSSNTVLRNPIQSSAGSEQDLTTSGGGSSAPVATGSEFSMQFTCCPAKAEVRRGTLTRSPAPILVAP